jgi:leucyl-tRNA synthetase
VTDFKPKGKSPLEDHPTFKYYKKIQNKTEGYRIQNKTEGSELSEKTDNLKTSEYSELSEKTYLRECDTLDTFMCSSFYFLRYPDAHNPDELIRKSLADKMFPIDFYSGGKEHSV